MSSKMYIVVRKDLDMPVGKLAGQVGHAAVRCVLAAMSLNAFPSDLFKDWLSETGGNEAKIVLQANSIEELDNVWDICNFNGLLAIKVIDSAKTVFSEPTLTCIGVGPLTEEQSLLFKDFKLYQ